MYNPIIQTAETPEWGKGQFPYIDYGDAPPVWVRAVVALMFPYAMWLEVKDRKLIRNWWR